MTGQGSSRAEAPGPTLRPFPARVYIHPVPAIDSPIDYPLSLARRQGIAFGGSSVADDKRDAPRPFDVRTVEYLLKLMSEHDLSEVELKEGDQRIRLRKGAAIPATLLPNPVHFSPTPASGTGPAVGSNSVPAPAAPARNLVEIKSPMVGTFYAKPKPDKPDYVSVGSRVTSKSVVCQVEAMKLFNEIAAEVSGTVVEVCVKNGDPVEYNQVLFRVEPA